MPVNTINLIGDQSLLGKVGSLSVDGDFYDDYITVIGADAPFLRNNAGLKTVTMPNLVTVNCAGLCRDSGVERADMPSATRIGADCFMGCAKLAEVNVPSLETLNGGAFRGCAFTTINHENFPSLKTSSGHYDFAENMLLTDVDLPTLEPDTQGNAYYMFYGCTKLKNVNLPNMVNLKSGTFENCTSLENIYLPKVNCSSAGGSMINYAFKNCTSLRRIFLPAQAMQFGTATSTGRAFVGDTALEIIRFPSVTSFYSGTVFSDSAPNMKLIDFGLATNIYGSDTSAVVRYTKILILRKADAITTIASTYVINKTTTPAAIKVYVPSALITSYESGTNWSSLLANGYVEFRALEGSRFENPNFDDTDIYNADRNSLDELL